MSCAAENARCCVEKRACFPSSKLEAKLGVALSFLAVGAPRQSSYSTDGKLVKKLVVS
jgi:hypothetical protein